MGMIKRVAANIKAISDNEHPNSLCKKCNKRIVEKESDECPQCAKSAKE